MKDPEAQVIIEAGTGSVEWVTQEFARADLSDKRLDRRLMKTAQHLAQSPASPINEACGDWASTQAAYRLFDNPKATPAAILEPHSQATVERMAGCGGPVLVMQDTVFFSYGRHPKTRGLGPIGKSNAAHDRGLIMHNALAFTVSGVPLGILSQNIWARQEVPEEGYQEKIERLQCTAIEEKESSKWLLALTETVERAPADVQVVTVADRESDFFEFLTQAQEQRAQYLIRARTDRLLVPEDSAGCASMLEALSSNAPALGTMTVEVPGNGRRQARVAGVEVRVARVTIKPPARRGQAKASASLEPVTVTVIGATEHDAPAGIEPISWVLLTNLPVQGFEGAAEKIEWYGKRWGIETWHKVLKSGCKVEDCLLEEGERLKRYLTLFSIIGVRLLHVATVARVRPDLPATAVFSTEEVEALHLRVHPALPPPQPPGLRETVRLLGRLGGHLGRKGDGEPGVTVLWRGWMRLYEDVVILRAHKAALGLTHSG
ncbi:MAG: IS4 family transposase [Acidiferrobacterales bacterium]